MKTGRLNQMVEGWRAIARTLERAKNVTVAMQNTAGTFKRCAQELETELPKAEENLEYESELEKLAREACVAMGIILSGNTTEDDHYDAHVAHGALEDFLKKKSSR